MIDVGSPAVGAEEHLARTSPGWDSGNNNTLDTIHHADGINTSSANPDCSIVGSEEGPVGISIDKCLRDDAIVFTPDDGDRVGRDAQRDDELSVSGEAQPVRIDRSDVLRTDVVREPGRAKAYSSQHVTGRWLYGR